MWIVWSVQVRFKNNCYHTVKGQGQTQELFI